MTLLKDLIDSKPSKSSLLATAWTRGYLGYKIHPCQLPLYGKLHSAIEDPFCLKYAVNCSRRFGKSTILLLIAFEYALKNPQSIIRFFAASNKQITEILEEVVPYIIDDCPTDIRPEYKKNKFYFKNKSMIHMAGLEDQQHDSARGRKSNLVVIDEAGFISEIGKIYKSVLLPTTLTTKGTIIFASTPSDLPGHDFKTIYEECKFDNNSATYTIDDNTMIDDFTKEQWIKEEGGRDSPDFLREYMCQFVTDSELAIIREWNTPLFVQDFPKDENYFYYKKYVGMDIGVKDFTAILYGYYHSKKGFLFIEGEDQISGNITTTTIAKTIKDSEVRLWAPNQIWSNQLVYRRVADNNNLILLNGLTMDHQISIFATDKDNLDAMVDEVRRYVLAGRIIVHPDCKFLIGCLENGIWRKSRNGLIKEFGRHKIFRHFDHLAALIYLVRNLSTFDPVPLVNNKDPARHLFNLATNQRSDAQKFGDIFSVPVQPVISQERF